MNKNKNLNGGTSTPWIIAIKFCGTYFIDNSYSGNEIVYEFTSIGYSTSRASTKSIKKIY